MHAIRAPLDGSLKTLLDIADFHAEHNPDLPWLIFPSLESPHETTSITFKEMVQASHRVAHILRPGRAGPEREVIALLLNTDTVLYIAIILGLWRAGFVVSVVSSLNEPGVTPLRSAVPHVTAQLTAGCVLYARGYLVHSYSRPGFHELSRQSGAV